MNCDPPPPLNHSILSIQQSICRKHVALPESLLRLTGDCGECCWQCGTGCDKHRLQKDVWCLVCVGSEQRAALRAPGDSKQ